MFGQNPDGPSLADIFVPLRCTWRERLCDEDFEYIRDDIYAPDRKKAFEDLDRARLKNIAVQFYTHHGGRDQPGYSFIHKSFGEYLTARALVKASEVRCEEYGKRNKWGSFAEDWLRLAG